MSKVRFVVHDEIDRNRFRRGVGPVLVAFALLAAACGSSDDDATIANAETSTSTTTTTTEPATTSTTTTEPATTSTTIDPWDDIPGWSGLEFGEVRTIRFEPAFKFVAPDGFDKDGLTTEWGTAIAPIGLEYREVGAERGPGYMLIRRLGEDSVDATVAMIEASATSVTPPAPTTIGGALAVTFDAEPGEGRVVPDDPAGDRAGALNWAFGGTWRFWIVDVDGAVVTIALFEDPFGLGRFDEALELLQPVLDSIEWRNFTPEA